MSYDDPWLDPRFRSSDRYETQRAQDARGAAGWLGPDYVTGQLRDARDLDGRYGITDRLQFEQGVQEDRLRQQPARPSVPLGPTGWPEGWLDRPREPGGPSGHHFGRSGPSHAGPREGCPDPDCQQRPPSHYLSGSPAPSTIHMYPYDPPARRLPKKGPLGRLLDFLFG